MQQLIDSKQLILYADDDPEDVELMQQSLAPYGAVELKTFPNGHKLISYLSQLTPRDPVPCLVILDIYMPLMNGWETLQRLHKMERFNAIPTLLLTTSQMECDRLGIQNYNAHFVAKPGGLAERDRFVDKIIAFCPVDMQKETRS